MKKIQQKINYLDNFSLSNLNVKQLQRIEKKLIAKKQKVENQLNELYDKVDKIKSSDDHDLQNFIPESFTTPLRKVITQNDKLKIIKEEYDRYNDEIKNLNNLIQEKILENNQINAFFGYSWLYKLKENSITILILFVLTLMTYEFSSQDISYSTIIKIFWIDTICCIMFLFNLSKDVVINLSYSITLA